MGLADLLRDLVDGAYAAALDDALWVGWADRLLGALGGSLGTLVALDTTTGAIKRLDHIRSSPKTDEEYVAYRMGELDPQAHHLPSLKRSGFYLDTDHVDPSDPSTGEFTRWITHNVGVKNHMTAVATLGGGRLHVGVSLHRAVADGPTPVAEQEKLAAILPEITRAMDLGFIHSEKLLDGYWSGLTAARTEPALLLDDDGRVLRATPALTGLLGADALDIRGERLYAHGPSDDVRLQALVARATARDAPRSAATQISRRSRKAAFIVTAFPLPRITRFLAPAEAAALVTVVDPVAAPQWPSSLWCEAFGLTPREGELATLLMTGHSLESAAAMQGTTLHTVRVQLRRIFIKTGTARQAELVRLLARVGRL
jgi:DNA-binding CsgD family transcriptional regulator